MQRSKEALSLSACLIGWALFPFLQAAAICDEAKQKSQQEKLNEKLERLLPPDGWTVQPPKDALKATSYVSVAGKNCTIKTTVSREAARDIGKFIDLYLELFKRIFTAKFIVQGPLTAVVFAHSEEFDAYYASVYRSGEKRTYPALYSPSKKETWIVLKGAGEKRTLPLETSKHELTHHMLHFFTGQASLPPWFDEGAACFFQYWDVGETMEGNIAKNFAMARQGDYGYFPTVILKQFGTDKFVPPSNLVAMNYEAFHTKDVDMERLHYSESWALVNFLTTTKVGQNFFNKIVTAFRSGEKLDKVLARDTLKSLQEAWYQDIEKRILPGLKGAAPSAGRAR